MGRKAGKRALKHRKRRHGDTKEGKMPRAFQKIVWVRPRVHGSAQEKDAGSMRNVPVRPCYMELEHFQKGCGNQRLENQGIMKKGCGKMEE